MAHVVLTGGTGFIGKRAHALLRERGHRVTLLGRPTCDLLDRNAVASTLPACDALVHLAGRANVGESIAQPALHLTENPAMLQNILDALSAREERPLVVLASTDRQYALHEGEINESAAPFPIEPYTASKMICETLLRCYAHRHEFPFIILRLDSVYGPGQPDAMFISDVIRKCFAATKITVGNLAIAKNFVFVDDVARAFLAAVHAPASAHNAVYNVAGNHTDLTQVLGKILAIMEEEYRRKIEVLSDPSVARNLRYEVKPFRCNLSHIGNALGWGPQTPLEEGLRETVRYFRSHAT